MTTTTSATAAVVPVTTSTTATILTPNIHIPYYRIRSDRALRWIYEHLARKKLSQKLNYLVSDREHLSNCYESFAFLQNQHYVEAFLICLKSIENDQLNLLTQIDPNLYKNQIDQIQHRRSTSHPDFSYVAKLSGGGCGNETMGNRNSVQFYYHNDDSDLENWDLEAIDQSTNPIKSLQMNRKFRSKTKRRRKKITGQQQFLNLKLRPWRSLPDFHHQIEQNHQKRTAAQFHRSRSNTDSRSINIPVPKLRLTAKVLAQQNRPTPRPSTSGSTSSADPTPGTSSQLLNHLMPISVVKCDDIQIHFDRKFVRNLKAKELSEKQLSDSMAATETLKQTSPMRIFSFLPKSPIISPPSDKSESIYSSLLLSAGSAPGDFVNTFITKDGEKIKKYIDNSFLEFGNDQFSPELIIRQSSVHEHHQRPLIGQSLTSFLQSGQFSRANSELERENAHFSVSEAMISAIEQIKWRNSEKVKTKKLAEHERKRTGTAAKKRKRRRRSFSIKSWQFCDNKHQQESVESNQMSSNDSACSNYSYTDESTDDDDDDHNENDDENDDGDRSFFKV